MILGETLIAEDEFVRPNMALRQGSLHALTIPCR
jgi:hypothetical protein